MAFNKTQGEIIGLVFGLFFSFSMIDVFLDNIAPIILKETSPGLNPLLTLLIGIISAISSYLTIIAGMDIFKKIDYTYKHYPRIFNQYMIKNILTFVITFIIALSIKIKYF